MAREKTHRALGVRSQFVQIEPRFAFLLEAAAYLFVKDAPSRHIALKM
jgi:hypothetical protein